MTISSTDGSLTSYASTSPEIPKNQKKQNVYIPPLILNTSPPNQEESCPSNRSSTESLLLKGMLKQQQYFDILSYLDKLSPGDKLHWLRENSRYHVPLMFAYAITALTYDDDNDIEDIACTIHLAELRIKQDLACFGYTEPSRERIADKIINHHINQILRVLNILYEGRFDKAYVCHEIDKYRIALPVALEYVDTGSFPRAKDWRIFYKVEALHQEIEGVKESFIEIHKRILTEFKARVEVINQKGMFTLKQRTPRYDDEIARYCSSLRIFFSPTEVDHSNILGLVVNRNKVTCVSLKEEPIDCRNTFERALFDIWSEKEVEKKHNWLARNAPGHHPLLLHELGISTFEQNPTLKGFKEAYDYILLGTIRVFSDAECASDPLIQNVPLVIKGSYIRHLIELAKRLSSNLEFTKIYWWEQFATSSTFSQDIINRFIQIYQDETIHTNPEWIFTHSWAYDPDKTYRYEEMNEFAFPSWLWKKRKTSLMNTLKTLSKMPDPSS